MPTDSEATAPDADDGPGVVDVDALMGDVRRRVAEKRARGEYTLDAVTLDTIESASAGYAQPIEELRSLAVQRIDLTPWPSQRAVAGPLLERARLVLTRTLSRPLYGLADQASTFNAALIASVATLSREVADLRREVADQAEELAALRAQAGAAPEEHGRH